ncbi:MAG: S9 family peptidase [Bacteroidales bacterium]|nr:S9 family peptidase [Bacteroidales bacterium]MBQ2551156.1 S9 family peptidase [Bacteroidales bacterium]
MKPQQGYIGPSEITVQDGKMSPEVLLSLGRLSDPRLSPDGKKILYGVSYTSIKDNRSVRNLFFSPLDGGNKVQLTFDGKSISCARWSKDGNSVYFIQGGQIYKAPFKAGKLGKKVKISDVPEGISEFEFSPDESQIMYVSSVKSAVQTPSDSDPALDKATAYATEDLMYRHWDHWVETIDHTYICPAGGGMITKDRSLDILGGPDVLYQLPNGPFGGIEQLSWSPDGRYVAYSCKKLTGKEYAFSTNTEIFIYCILTGETTKISDGGGYDTDPVWSPDGKAIAWLHMERDGYEADKTDLFLAELKSEEEGEGQTSNPAALNIRNLTSGFAYNVAGPVWAEDSKSIYFNSLVEGLQGIFNIRTDNNVPGEQGLTRLTPDGAWFDFGSPFAVLEDGTLLATYCSMDFPTEIVAVKDGEFKAVTSENAHILSQLKGHKTEMRKVKTVDGKDMLTWVLLPPDFDSTKVYPAIEICLGGPQGTLSQGWSYRWNYCLMANQGYVVVLPNRRGTTAFGQPWCEQISGDYIGLNMQDYLSAAKMIKAEPYVGKLAACGASYGGYSVYYLAGIHGDIYDCFIAHAGIFNEEHMYMTTEEMWFPNWDNGGIPEEYAYEPGQIGPKGDGKTFGGIQQAGSPWSTSPKAVRHYSNSPHTLVKNWHTPILCIHGGSDFRVPYDEGMAAFNAAQMMGVPSKLIVFPDENHWILKPQNALYWHRSYFEWLSRWL